MLFASQNTLRFRYRCHMDRRKQISLFIDSNLLSKANCDQLVPYKSLLCKTEAPLLVNLIQGSKLIKASFGEGGVRVLMQAKKCAILMSGRDLGIYGRSLRLQAVSRRDAVVSVPAF